MDLHYHPPWCLGLQFAVGSPAIKTIGTPSKTSMPNHRIRQRLVAPRPMTSITLQIPEDVIASTKAIAPLRGMVGYQNPLKAYISEGLRRDEVGSLSDRARCLADAMRARGIGPELLEQPIRGTRVA
jgi:hypothetical protein